MQIEGFTLLMTTAQAVAALDAMGWTHRVQGGVDGTYSVLGDPPIDDCQLRFERDRLMMIRLRYDPPQPERALDLARSLPFRTSVPMLRAWGAFTQARDVAIHGDVAGATLTVVHLGLLSDAREVDGVWATYGAGIERPPRSAV